MAWVLAFLSIGAPLLAQKPGEVHFTITTPESALLIEREYRPPNQALITRVRLGLDEPTWLPNVPGFPQLPFVTRVVAMPVKSEIGTFTVTPGKAVVVQGVGLVEWGQLPRAGGGREPRFPLAPDGKSEPLSYGGPDEVPPNPAITAEKVWPRQMVELIETRDVAGFQLLTYRIYPVQWFPFDDTLVLQTTIDVDIRFEPAWTPAAHSYAEAMQIQEVRSMVCNPHTVVDPDPYAFPAGPDTRYLIITDNYKWSSSMTRGAGVGDMVGAFRQLASWKSEKGLNASVVTITDIVNGTYGDFTVGACDLQEVIRNFLKFANREWSTYWVLLGGNVEIIPVREVVSGLNWDDCYLSPGGATPDQLHYYVDTATNTVRIHAGQVGAKGAIGADTLIVAFNNGKAFSRNPGGAVPSATNPGWAYTDSTYTSETTTTPGEYIFLRGQLADIQGTDFYSVQYINTIPTDLYYSALGSEGAGAHDWDANDNGLYGQLNSGTASEVDGVSFTGTIAVGRAPVASATEAETFALKVVVYEQYAGGLPPAFGRRLLLGADDWFGGPEVKRSSYAPPAEEFYFSADGSTTAVLHFKGPPGDMAGHFRLIAWNQSGDWWEVPYNEHADAANLGFHYCSSDSFSDVVSVLFWIGDLSFEIFSPTQFVKVDGPTDRVRPAVYFFDQTTADGSVYDKEHVRAVLALRAPGLDQRKRIYKDVIDAPGYPDAPDLGMLSETTMRDALNSGFNIVSLSGHGGYWGCCGVNESWVPSLLNYYEGGFVYADSCLTNEFNKPKGTNTDDAVSELFLKNPRGGAAAYLGNSRFSIIGLGNVFERLFWDRLATTRRLGVLHKSKETNTADGAARWVNYSLNLLGDPEMPLWLASPLIATVSHSATVSTGSPLTVWVSSAPSVPLRGAVVCLAGPAGVYVVAQTDDSGAARLGTTGASVGDRLKVTVTADGYRPYQGTVSVSGVRLIRRRLGRS